MARRETGRTILWEECYLLGTPAIRLAAPKAFIITGIPSLATVTSTNSIRRIEKAASPEKAGVCLWSCEGMAEVPERAQNWQGRRPE